MIRFGNFSTLWKRMSMKKTKVDAISRKDRYELTWKGISATKPTFWTNVCTLFFQVESLTNASTWMTWLSFFTSRFSIHLRSWKPTLCSACLILTGTATCTQVIWCMHSNTSTSCPTLAKKSTNWASTMSRHTLTVVVRSNSRTRSTCSDTRTYLMTVVAQEKRAVARTWRQLHSRPAQLRKKKNLQMARKKEKTERKGRRRTRRLKQR